MKVKTTKQENQEKKYALNAPTKSEGDNEPVAEGAATGLNYKDEDTEPPKLGELLKKVL